jgi:hypothetical protein
VLNPPATEATPASPPMVAPIDALQQLPLAVALRESVWAFPLLEIVHIAAIAAMVGSVLMIEMRVFGLRKALPLVELGQLGAGIAIVAFAVIVASGSLLFLTDPVNYIANPAFAIKLGLIAVAATNMVAFHARGSLARPDAIAKAQAALSLLLWLGVIGAGRMIAYI